MSNQEQAPASNTSPMDDLASYHQELVEKYKNTKTEGAPITPATKDIVSFNGYYSMDNQPGAFFTIDTNMHVTTPTGVSSAIYDVSFIISMDGKSSVRIPFTGTFQEKENKDGYQLIQKSAGVGGTSQFNLNLTFTRKDLIEGTTANFTGSITIAAPGHSPVNVTGNTYNNTIPYSRYQGHYHTKASDSAAAYPVAFIDEDYSLQYNFNYDGEDLTRIETYTYNMNMYYFSFKQVDDPIFTFSLIMGTSPSAGLVCNNLIAIDQTPLPIQRSLQTITTHNKKPYNNILNANSKALSKFSGYYPITAINSESIEDNPIKKGAFIAIEGDYTTTGNSSDTKYKVTIGVSVDGTTTDTYIFDNSMSFTDTDKTLTIPGTNTGTTESTTPVIKIKFASGYKESIAENGLSGSLVTITGTSNSSAITGDNYLNPVPLSAFSGLAMTNKNGDSVTIKTDYEVVISGTTVSDFTYVPLMYILGTKKPIDNNQTMETLLSLGTNSSNGNTCIKTLQKYEGKTKEGLPEIDFLSVIHSPKKNQKTQTNTKKPALA